MVGDKTHPEDAMLAALVASSSEFSAHLRRGPHDKVTTRGLPSYAAAKAEAERLNATSAYGRRAMVYAITPQGYTVPVDDKLAALAGLAL